MQKEAMNEAGNRYSVGKAKWSLWLSRVWPALRVCVTVAEKGAAKYGVDNWWQKELDEKETCNAAQNHLFAVMSGVYIDAEGNTHLGDNDPESGLPHWAHAAWNVIAIGALRIKRERGLP